MKAGSFVRWESMLAVMLIFAFVFFSAFSPYLPISVIPAQGPDQGNLHQSRRLRLGSTSH
jgi:hypothetical protein